MSKQWLDRYLGLVLIYVLVGCSTERTDAQPLPDSTYRNPVFNHDFPDPNLVRGPDGYFYAYSTQTDWRQENYGGPYIIPVLRSKNLVKWSVVGDALMQKPSWKSSGGIWAPDAVFYNNRYYLYYSFSTWGDPDPGIGVATAAKPSGPFTDHGKLFLSSEIGVANSIDAFLFEEDGKPFLVWGSFQGIFGIELSADGLKVKGEKFQLAGNAYEGSYILKRNGYYYYFGSMGSCCEGAASTYRLLVGRSENFKGPYIDQEGKPLMQNGGTLLLERNTGNEGFIGPGHNGDIIEDESGQSWILYHAFPKVQPNKRVMLLDKIIWNEGWPFIEKKQPGIEDQSLPRFSE